MLTVPENQGAFRLAVPVRDKDFGVLDSEKRQSSTSTISYVWKMQSEHGSG